MLYYMTRLGLQPASVQKNLKVLMNCEFEQMKQTQNRKGEVREKKERG